MQKIKFLSNNQILLNNKIYQGYNVGELPDSFGFIYNQDKEQDGISEWFNFKGLTYVAKYSERAMQLLFPTNEITCSGA